MNGGRKEVSLISIKVRNENVFNGFQIKFYSAFAMLFL